MNFDPREAHGLVCIQSNREIPESARECVCPSSLPRTFQPTYDVDGPYVGGPFETGSTIVTWAKWIAGIAIVSFTAVALLRHFGVF